MLPVETCVSTTSAAKRNVYKRQCGALSWYAFGPSALPMRAKPAARRMASSSPARKMGTTTFAEVGRFTATPFHVLIPMTTTEAERGEIEGKVFAKDQPFGLPSDIVE